MDEGSNEIYLAVRSLDVRMSAVDTESEFLCPENNQAIVGICLDQEKGSVVYKYGGLSFLHDDDSKVYEYMMSNVIYSDYMEKSNFSFSCPEGAVIVGRETAGENGKIRYVYRMVYGRKKGRLAWIGCKPCPEMSYKCGTEENGGKWAEQILPPECCQATPEETYYTSMYGMSHGEDENGDITVCFTCLEI